MKLDEGLKLQKQSLDLTPLIDVVFLLVLFFAVSTSFISSEDLQALKNNVVQLSADKASLSNELTQAADQVNSLRSQLALADRKAAGLEDSVDTLRREKRQALDNLDSLESRLEAVERELGRQQERIAELDGENAARAERIQVLQQQLEERSGSLARARQEAERADQELDRANGAIGRLDEELTGARDRIERLEAELAEYRELGALDREQLDRMLAAQQILESNLDEVMQNDQLNIQREERLVILQLSDRILFDSGSAEIKAEGVEVLKEVGSTIKSTLQGLRIQVAGHTDNVPVSAAQGRWSDNWSLSAARAVNVLQLLEEEVGIDPALLSAVGYGEHRPIADNDSAAGRAKNRRIELVLVPQ